MGVKDTSVVSIEHPNDLANGDFSTNVALRLSKEMKKSPLEIAQAIADELGKDKKLKKVISKIEAVKPGFVNFYLSEEYLLGEVAEVLKKKDKYGQQDLGKKRTAMIEYSQIMLPSQCMLVI